MIVETPDGRQALVAYSLGNLVSNMGWEVYPAKSLDPGKDSSQRVEARGGGARVAGVADMIRAQGVDYDQDDVGSLGQALAPAARGERDHERGEASLTRDCHDRRAGHQGRGDDEPARFIPGLCRPPTQLSMDVGGGAAIAQTATRAMRTTAMDLHIPDSATRTPYSKIAQWATWDVLSFAQRIPD